MNPDQHSLEPDEWERQPAETAKAYTAFSAFRDAEDRTLQKAADTVGKSRSQMKRWAAEHAWKRRARAWDMDQDRIWTEQLQADRRHISQRHAQTARSVLTKSLRRLAQINIATLSPAEVIRWADFAIRLERDIYGLTIDEKHTDTPVQIIIDPRLLPADATPQPTTADNDHQP